MFQVWLGFLQGQVIVRSLKSLVQVQGPWTLTKLVSESYPNLIHNFSGCARPTSSLSQIRNQVIEG